MRKTLTKVALLSLLLACGVHPAGAVQVYVYTADNGKDNGSVFKIAPDGTKTVIATGFAQPVGIAIGPNGNVFVGESAAQDVIQIAPDGTKSFYSGTNPQGSVPGLSSAYTYDPRGLLFDPSGTLYVNTSQTAFNANNQNNYVNKIAPGGGAGTSAVTQFAVIGTGGAGLAMDSQHNLWAATRFGPMDAGYSTITRIAPNGTATLFTNALPPVLQGLAFDASGNLWASNAGSGEISYFANVGGALSTTPTSFLTGLANLRNLAFASNGDLYATIDNNLVKFQATGGVLSPTQIVIATNISSVSYTNYIALQEVADIPEPASFALLSLGLAGLAAGRFAARRGLAAGR
jgi:sugar lactone lactonase YvrE